MAKASEQGSFKTRGVDKLEPPAAGRKEYFDPDLPGFGLRVSAEGRRTWICRYRVKGHRHKSLLTIGTYRASDSAPIMLTLADARDIAKDALRAAEKGRDPADDKRKRLKAETFKELAELYVERYAKGDPKNPRKRSWRKDQNIINKDLIPELGNRKAGEITRGEAREVLRGIEKRGAPIMANRTLEVARKIYNWALAEDVGGIEANPFHRIPKPAAERRRDRVLTDDEIRAVWGALPSIDPVVADAYRLVFYTAARIGEVTGLPRIELSEPGWWNLPAERSKNKLPHRIPLVKQAQAVIAERRKRNAEAAEAEVVEETPWIFPAPKGGPWRWMYGEHAELVKAAGVSNFGPHDIRRTLATRLGSMGISRLVIGKVLNHAERGVTAVYDRSSYDREKGRALAAWARKLEEILAAKAPAENVTEFRRA
jgi:integrase